jgi:hypothetical protein
MEHREIIERLGGIRALRKALGHKNDSTVQGWKVRNSIPDRHQPAVLGVAHARGVGLDPADFFPVPMERAG